MRIKIGDKVYAATAITNLSLADILTLQAELQQLGGINGVSTWAQIEGIAHEFAGLSAEEAQASEHMLLMTCLSFWAARRNAGERVGFLESVDFPMSDVTYLPDPEDHKPGKGKAGSGKAGKNARSPRMSPVASTPDSSSPAT